MRKKKLREAKVLQQEAELGFNPSLWSFPVTVRLLSEKNKQCEGQSWECAHHVLWAVNGPVRLGEWWVLTGGRNASTSPGCSCSQDLLTVPEYSFCVNSFWLLSELGSAQGLSYSPSSGGHFSSPQGHDVVFGPYFGLSLLLVLGI